VNISALSRAELAAVIVETLAADGIAVVLVGGSCACIYTNERFASLDLDFIDMTYARKSQIAKALAAIGFVPDGSSRYFTHADCQWSVEFPSAPLAVGDEILGLDKVAEMETPMGTIKMLSPTDCAKDRLLNAYLYNDEQCYAQAFDLACNHNIMWGDLKKWHAAEGYADEYADFRAEVMAAAEK
jgi:hypothetical protein